MTNTIRTNKFLDSSFQFREHITIALVAVMIFINPLINMIQPSVQIVRVPVTVEKEVIRYVPVRVTKADRTQLQCLAENVYFEARNQPVRGQIAVTNVVMNRVNDRRFPNTPCSVVKQRSSKGCQFSWVCEGKSPKHIANKKAFEQAHRVVEDVYFNNIQDITDGAKFYHATYVSPSWANRMNMTTIIGSHKFYR